MKLKIMMFVIIAFSLGACGGGDDSASSSSSSSASLSFPANIELISD